MTEDRDMQLALSWGFVTLPCISLTKCSLELHVRYPVKVEKVGKIDSSIASRNLAT